MHDDITSDHSTTIPSAPPASKAPEPRLGAEPLPLWALAAEARVADLQSQIHDLSRATDDARQDLAASERRRQIERHLTAHGVIDLDTAILLADSVITDAATPDVAAAVADLKQRKSFLFRPAPARRVSSMSSEPGAVPQLDDAALDARRSGDRRALLRYLRLRRGG